MKLRRMLRLKNLRRPRIRQSWNKYNLFNLANLKLSEQSYVSRTFFQQKWEAKAMTRAYHGNHIKEGVWERMFSRKFNTVVDMDPRYMALQDGSEQAAGRGSGKQVDPTKGHSITDEKGVTITNLRSKKRTPYMQMTYAPQERRLDIAIFRALFASSASQARQFCVHGFVKVNGREMRYPGYLLNPGDMFQVEPDRVMMATGMKKGCLKHYYERQKNGGKRKAAAKAGSEEAEEVEGVQGEEAPEAEEASAEDGTPEPVKELTPEEAEAAEAAKLEENKETLKTLVSSVRQILTLKKNKGEDLAGKQKQKLRAFVKEARGALSRAGGKQATAEGTTLEVAELSELLKTLKVSVPEPVVKADTEGEGGGDATAAKSKDGEKDETKKVAKHEPIVLTPDEQKQFEELMAEYNENPIDLSKPYWTPWKPRKFVSPFVFIPRYLEVNQNICSAVYLRHPVARSGESEVPSPFPEFIGQLAFNYYLRRR